MIQDILARARAYSLHVYALIFLSGFTGLVYEVVWQKYLSYFLGSHGKATAIILAIFFLFLSLGYHFFGRYGHRLHHNKLLLYGIIEGLIGLYSLLSPSVFNLLSTSFPFWSTHPLLDLLYSMLFTACLIGFPTFLMGGTIPILADALISSPSQSHRIHAIIYGTNTAGAFGGTICAGFIFLEWWGLPLTLMYTGLVNIGICAVIYVQCKNNPESYQGLPIDQAELPLDMTQPASPAVQWAVMLVSFMSGFYVFSLESLVIRMAGISLGSTTYTFSIIVAAFILALALGSLFISFFQKIIHYRILIVVQSLLLLAWFAVYLSIPDWPIWFSRIYFVFTPLYFNFSIYWASVFVLFVMLLLIPVGLMGMNLPLLFNYLKSHRAHFSATVGRIYSMNTLASTLGAAIGGYLLFFYFRFEEVFQINLILMAATIPLVAYLTAQQSWIKAGSLGLGVIATIAALLIPTWGTQSFSPPPRFTTLLNTPDMEIRTEWSQQLRKITHVANLHGPDSMVDIFEDEDGQANLYVNAQPISHTKKDRHVRALNALMAIYLTPHIDHAFFVGLGPGLGPSLTTHLQDIETVDVAEISKATIDARKYFKKFHGAYTAQEDKLRIIHSDAFRVLRQSPTTYDLIVSEPAHPWITGVENLYSLEFLMLAKSKMNAHAVYAQWFPLVGIDDDTMMTIINTFQSVFPWVTLWSPEDGVVLILASPTVREPHPERFKAVYENYQELFQEFGLNHYLSPLVLQIMSQPALSELLTNFQGTQSIEFPKVAFRAGRSLFAGDNADLQRFILKVIEPPDGTKDFRFMYEKLPEAHSMDFFHLALKPVSKFKGSFKSVNMRFKLLYQEAYPENEDLDVPEKTFQGYQYFMTGDDRYLATKDLQEGKNLGNMYKQYISLISASLPANYDALARLIPEHCADYQCQNAVSLIRKVGKLGPKPMTGLFGNDSSTDDILDKARPQP